MVLAKALRVESHWVRVGTTHCRRALALLEAGLEPDLVILDMNMPGLGGIGTLPRLPALVAPSGTRPACYWSS